MERRTLLLNRDCSVLAFIDDRRALKLFFKDKAEIVAVWEESFNLYGIRQGYPAVIRLKCQIYRPNKNAAFSRRSVFKRDEFKCQYCGIKVNPNRITVDHIVPKIAGGQTSFLNCVGACGICNNKKGGRTPEQAGMKLIKKPTIPCITTLFRADSAQEWHGDWNSYIKL